MRIFGASVGRPARRRYLFCRSFSAFRRRLLRPPWEQSSGHCCVSYGDAALRRVKLDRSHLLYIYTYLDVPLYRYPYVDPLCLCICVLFFICVCIYLLVLLLSLYWYLSRPLVIYLVIVIFIVILLSMHNFIGLKLYRCLHRYPCRPSV